MVGVNGVSREDEHIAMFLDFAMRRLRRDLTELTGPAYPTLRGSHFRLLQIIPAGGARVTDLAERAAMTKQALGQLVDHLQAGGFVESLPLPADRRVRIVRRTAKGDEARQHALDIIARLEDAWRAELGDRRYAAMRNALRDVGGAMGQATV